MDKKHTKSLKNRNASRFPYQVLNNNELDRICYRTIEKLKKYPMFDGLILTGSFAKDNQDIYSDIDFVIVVQEKSLADGFALWKSFLSCLNSVLVLDELAPLECRRWLDDSAGNDSRRPPPASLLRPAATVVLAAGPSPAQRPRSTRPARCLVAIPVQTEDQAMGAYLHKF